jgi:2-aminoadipate transaminase
MIRWNSLYAERARADHKDLVSGTGRQVINMSAGFPEPSLFPVEEVPRLIQSLAAEDGKALLQYNPPAGYEPLRAWIAKHSSTQDTRIETEQVLLTHGAQQGLDVVAKLLVEPGDCVLVEGPSFHGALWVFQAADAKIVTIPLEGEGMRLDVLEARLSELHEQGGLPKFIYTIPTFHNPTGYTATLERRLGLLELAERFGVPIVEDVPYNDLWYDAAPPPTLLELAGPERVIQVGTFSKTLCPALRVGWMIGPAGLIQKARHFKHIADTCSSGILQRVAYRLIQEGFWEHNVSRARELYRAKRDALTEAFATLNVPGVTCTVPSGGFFAWMKLPEGISSQKFQQFALEHGVSIAASPMFFADGKDAGACRLTISFPSPEQIRQGTAKLGEAMQRFFTHQY